MLSISGRFQYDPAIIMKEEAGSILFATPRSRWAIPLLLAIFAAGLLTIMPNFHAYFFGDEHFYTDSAMRMDQTGQLLTPTYPDGALRFNKPVLSYWMILSGFRLFGISVLSSRLASLLAGLAILLLTRQLAVRLFKSSAAGWLAMLILASNLELITAAMRATPDIFLCLFSLLSLYGFAGLLLGEHRSSDAWLAYVGAGLAIASKGMLGVLLLLFVFLFAVSRVDRAARLRALLRPLPMLACLVLGLSWFVAVYLKYGDLALHGFLNDQVGNRVSSSAGGVLANLFQYSLGLAAPFFPWSLLLLAGLIAGRPLLAGVRRSHAASFTFVFAWYALVLFIFSPANLTRTRYLLPAFPLLAAGLAALLPALLAHPAVSRLARRILQVLAAAALVFVVVFLLMALGLERVRLVAAAAAFLLLAATLLLGLRRGGPSALPPLLALATFVILWDFHFLVRPAFPSTPSYEMVGELQQAGVKRVFFPLQELETMTREEVSLYKEKYASQVRLISGGTIRVDRLKLDTYLAREKSVVPMICVGDDVHLFPSSRFTAVRAGSVYKSGIGPAEVRRILAAADKPAALETLYIPYYIVYPKKDQEPERPPAP